MTNSNDNPNPNRSDGSDAKWSEFLDQDHIDGLPKNLQGLRPDDIDDARFDELEVDSLLHQLGKHSTGENQHEFTNRVVARIADSASHSRRNGALPVPSPSYNKQDSAQAGSAAIELESSDATVLAELDVPDESRFSLPRNWLAVGATLLIGVAIFTAFHFLQPGQVGEQIGTQAESEMGSATDSEQAIADARPTDLGNADSEASIVQSNPRNEKEDALPDSQPTGSAQLSNNNDRKPQQSADSKVAVSSKDAPPKNNDAFNPVFDNLPEETADANAKPKTDVAQTDVANAGSEKPMVRIANQPEGDWQFVVRYNDHGIGSINLNGLDLPSVLLNRNTNMLFREISSEVKRRFAFLEPRMTKGISGSITVADKTFAFDSANGLPAAFDAARAHIDHQTFESITVDELFKIRDEYLVKLKRSKNRTQYTSLTKTMKKNSLHQIAQKSSLQFALEEEIGVLTEVTAKTTQVLQQLCKDRLALERRTKLAVTEPAHRNRQSIDNESFSKFASSGKLDLPKVASRGSVLQLQGFDSEQLKLELHGSTHSLDIFHNTQEMLAAQRFVFSNDQMTATQYSALRDFHVQLEDEINRLSKIAALPVEEEERLHTIKNEFAFVTKQLRAQNGETLEPLKEILPHRTDLQGLPLVMGDDCHLNKNDAKTMASVSKLVGETIGQFDLFASRDASQNTLWRYMLLMQEISNCCELDNPTQAFKTLEQMLQIDHPRLRMELIETVRASKSKAAIELLVRRAKFDIQPEVRVAATKALEDFDTREVRQKLLAGFDYPWHVVAQHSAETLVGLGDQDAIPQLIDLLEKKDPRLPFEVSDAKFVQHELVAVNHMKNCMLCHAPSTDETDEGRGLTPTFERPIPMTSYYAPPEIPTDSAFVRADVTYLRQDFSVIQKVADHGPWPEEQRFDYVVQKKNLSPEQATKMIDAINAQENKNRAAVVFALEKLTGQVTENNSREGWTTVYEKLQLE